MTSRAEKRRQRARKRNEDRAAARGHIPGDTQPDETPAVREVVDHSQGSPRSRVERIPRHERARAQTSSLDEFNLSTPERSAAEKFQQDWYLSGLYPWGTGHITAVSGTEPKTPGSGPRFPEFVQACEAMNEFSGWVVRRIVLEGHSLSALESNSPVTRRTITRLFRTGIHELAVHYGYARQSQVEAA